jgi:hypothetical protein
VRKKTADYCDSIFRFLKVANSLLFAITAVTIISDQYEKKTTDVEICCGLT